ELLERLGGGTVNTVFALQRAATAAVWKDGPPAGVKCAAKVANPNILYRSRIFLQDARATLAELRREAPDDPYYALVEDQLLPDIEEWIREDVLEENFLEKDAALKSIINKQKRPRDHTFELYVPQSYAPWDRHVKLEEFISGTNLTELKLPLDQMKEVISL